MTKRRGPETTQEMWTHTFNPAMFLFGAVFLVVFATGALMQGSLWLAFLGAVLAAWNGMSFVNALEKRYDYLDKK